MTHDRAIDRVVDLLDPRKNVLFNATTEQARTLLAAGDVDALRDLDGHFALVATRGQSVLLTRSLGRPLRYFIAKRSAGPCLVAADRIDVIHRHLQDEGLADQFHPSYTRMAPAHYVTEVKLLGCPDPNPTYRRFFTPSPGTLPPDIPTIGRAYIAALSDEIAKWLTQQATDGPVGVSFSGGIDSGSVLLVTYHAMLRLGISPARLKAFTLSIDGGGEDLAQARRFLEEVGLAFLLEPIEIRSAEIDWRETVRTVEDYKPLDVQSASMALALCRGIRKRYPAWRWLLDGDGGDENLKDYPIEENTELTIRSVLNNRLLYQEGWGVDSIKHSLTYSGGLSRGYTRTYAPADRFGFAGFSPFTLPRVIAVAEAIPFIELTGWSHDRLYELKGEIVAAGVEAITGYKMPIYPKRRFQHGAAARFDFERLFPARESDYRRAFHALYE
jgi:asparagine synthase (glutamine-hydrolysing)